MTIKNYDFMDKQSFKLVVLGDMHLGDPLCDLDLIKETINFVKNTPDCYVIINGDIMNNAIINSKSDTISETLTMEQQQDLAIELFYPIKERILIIADGNHENRTYKLTGINPLRYVARALGCLDKYTHETYLINIRMAYKGNSKNSSTFRIFGQHGSYGGGRKVGSAANTLQEMSAVVANANLYIRSHTHNHISFHDDCYIVSQYGNLIRHRRTYYNAMAFLKYGGYAADKGYRLTDVAPSVLNIRICKQFNKELKKDEVFFKTDIIKI